MCRWHSMSRREKCRCISLVIVALMAIAGIVALIYGSVQIFRVSKEGLATDGADVSSILGYFVKCSEYEAPAGAWSSDVIGHAIKLQCVGKQLPARLVSGFAGGFMILALLCVPAAFKKDKMFGFTMWSTLAIGTIVMAVTLVSVYALPAATQMVPDCSQYDAATVQELQNLGIVCLKGVENMAVKTTALKWMCKLHTFYAGSALCVASLLLFFFIKHSCCCNPNVSCCSSSSACATDANHGEHPCVIRRAVHKLKARFCRRSQPALSSADGGDGVPVNAPSYYQVNAEGEAASEDAGVSSSPSSSYYGVN